MEADSTVTYTLLNEIYTDVLCLGIYKHFTTFGTLFNTNNTCYAAANSVTYEDASHEIHTDAACLGISRFFTSLNLYRTSLANTVC